MKWPSEPLLAGPRGRRLCYELLNQPDGPGDLDGESLLHALADSVTWARYWQEPDDTDQTLAEPHASEILKPIAEAVTAAPAAAWWASPIDRGGQRYVQWLGDPELSPPRFAGAQAALAAWRAQAVADEREAGSRPSDPAAPWSGSWWSTPAEAGLMTSTRRLTQIEAVGLVLIEDTLGWTRARCWPLAVRPEARVFEITGPERWAELVGRYPFEVSLSRRHDWWRATGRAGRWLMPDWTAVAADYDGVHLSATGYLTTAGRALAVDDAATVLAGWHPDQTFWLGDVLSAGGAPVQWHGDAFWDW